VLYELDELLKRKDLAQDVRARRELEVYVARHVFRWTALQAEFKYTHLTPGDWVGYPPQASNVLWIVPHYTDSFTKAWLIVREMVMHRDWHCELQLKYLDQSGAVARASFGYIPVVEYGLYAAHIAICKAALAEVLDHA